MEYPLMGVRWCPPTARLPLEPLLEKLGAGTLLGNARLLPGEARSNHAQMCRWRIVGLSPWQADHAAVRAGFHPLNVWGDAWLDACAWIDPQGIEEWRRRDVDIANAMEARRCA